jgi:hypothetical protein
MPIFVIVWIGGLALALPVLCAVGRAAHRFDDEADDGLRRLMLRELARRRGDRRSRDRRRTPQAVGDDRRRIDRRAGERREDRITNTKTITLNDHPEVVVLPRPAAAARADDPSAITG